MAIRWAAEVASGLELAHEHAIYHRDIKPSNIFLTRDRRAVLLDFGIAARPAEGSLTATAAVVGTPWYMAPEQARGDPASAATDVWGLTATLYHTVTRQPPYSGGLTEVLSKLMREDPVPAVRLAPGLPRDVQAILDHGMERAVRRRYAAVSDLGRDLRAFLEHQPVSARPLGRIGRAWRRVQLAPAKALAVTATVAAAGLAIWLSVTSSALSERQRRERIAEIKATLPALLAVEGQPEQRLVASLGPEREQLLGLLAELLALDPTDIPARMWRAALHQDNGDHEASAADIAAIAEHAESPYFRELVARYRRAAPGDAGTTAVDLSGMPEAETDQELFVSGFHELRNRHVTGFAERAERAFRDAMETYPDARDLRLIALLALRRFQEAHDEAIWLEGRYDRPTARTRAVIGSALGGLKHYKKAIEPLLQSLEFRPGRHGPLQNLGLIYLRLKRFDEAEASLRAAAAARPHFLNTTYTLAQLDRERGEFDRAYETVMSIEVPEPDSEGWGWKKAYLRADIRRREAFQLFSQRRFDEFEPLAEEVLRLYRLASKFRDMPPGRRATCRQYAGLVRSLRKGDATDNLERFWPIMMAPAYVADPYKLEELWAILPPKGIGPDMMASLRMYLLHLAKHLNPNDTRFAERMKELEKVTRRDRERLGKSAGR